MTDSRRFSSIAGPTRSRNRRRSRRAASGSGGRSAGHEAAVDAIPVWDVEVLSQGRPAVLAFYETPLDEKRTDLLGEQVDIAIVDVEAEPEAVGGAGLEPLLQVVGKNLGRTHRGGVVVDDAVGEHLARGPALPRHVESVQGPGVERARTSGVEFLARQWSIEVPGPQGDAEHLREVAHPGGQQVATEFEPAVDGVSDTRA